jgi:hypothetical protein
MSLPEYYTPQDLADRLGWSISRVRNVARRAGACRVIGRTMLFIDEDVAIMEAIANGELKQPPPIETRKYSVSSHVYFFQQSNFIKIGWSKKWRTRLVTLQTSSPLEIKVLAVYRGGITLERNLHTIFAEHRVRLEWFQDRAPIQAYIEANKHKCCKNAKVQK